MRTSSLFRRLAVLPMAGMALLASAQSVSEFPCLLKAEAAPIDEVAAKIMKAPLNTEKPKGAYVFGSMLDDYSIFRNFASTHVNTPSQLDKLHYVYDPDPENYLYEALFVVTAGCNGGDGYYYGFRYKRYTFEYVLHSFIKADPYTGTFETIREWPEYNDQIGLPFIYDMAYNPEDGALYAIAPDPDSPVEEAYSMIGTINPRTGDFNKICSLNRYYFGIAFDYDGNLHGISWKFRANTSNQLDVTGARLDRFEYYEDDEEFDLKKSTDLMVDGTPFKAYYQHGLDFDYTTGDLIWAATNTDFDQFLVKVDPNSAKTTNMGRIGINEKIAGLYVPYITADSRTAPARVENLSFAFDATGANKTTLSWTNPTTQWNREALSDLVEVNIYRDNMKSAPVGTVEAAGKVGEKMSWTDESATQGLHKYYVVPSSKKGEKGVLDSISCFVGHDLPGSPVNISGVSPDGRTVVLTWDVPTRGDSDGWFDKESLTYTVTREQDGKVIASDIAERTCTDSDIPEATRYTYAVVAKSPDGAGLPGVSNAVFAGKNVKIPFSSIFETQIEAERFSYLDNNGDGNRFTYGYNTNLGGTRMCYKIDRDRDNDDYLISPPLEVKDGHSYRVTITMSVGGFGYVMDPVYTSYGIVGGTSMSNLNEEYVKNDDFVFECLQYDHKKISAEFTANHDGEHYVALYDYSKKGKDEGWTYVEDFLIEEIFDNDLEATAIDVPGIISSENDALCPNTYRITVTNPGMKTQSDYKVKIAFKTPSGQYIDINEVTDVPTLAHNQSKVINVKGYKDGYTKAEDGDYSIVAIVELNGDEQMGNNETAPVAVHVDQMPALNYTMTQNKRSYATYPPMNFYNSYSTYQTIYSPEMMRIELADNQGSAFMSRIAYHYNSTMDINNTDVRIYLSQTPVEYLVSGKTNWITTSPTKVFDGSVDIKRGEGWLDFVFDTPFEFDPDMSLVVTVQKFNNSVVGDFPVMYEVFDYETDPDFFHTNGYVGEQELDFMTGDLGKSFTYAAAPVLYAAIPGVDGVQGIEAIENSGISYEDGQLLFSGDIREAIVWTIDGKLVKKANVAKGAVALDVLPGIYVVKAIDAAGNAYTSKVSVSK